MSGKKGYRLHDEAFMGFTHTASKARHRIVDVIGWLLSTAVRDRHCRRT
jgi:hypothetical protein